MPYACMIFPNPLDAHVALTPDSGAQIVGVPTTDSAGRPGQLCNVPEGTPSHHGAELRIEAPGFTPLRVRGLLVIDAPTMIAHLQVDDYTLTAEPVAPAPGPTPPPTGGTPIEIINSVFTTTHPNLATIEGCGKFTEDCCNALRANHSQAWGHIDKDPGQNQYHGHAVDALMLLYPAAGTVAGIYDIIFSSASHEAKPVFNYVSPPNFDDWVYPPESATRGVLVVSNAGVAGQIQLRRDRTPRVAA